MIVFLNYWAANNEYFVYYKTANPFKPKHMCKHVIKKGYKDITLTGKSKINTTSYYH